jgi:hypothetical protein
MVCLVSSLQPIKLPVPFSKHWLAENYLHNYRHVMISDIIRVDVGSLPDTRSCSVKTQLIHTEDQRDSDIFINIPVVGLGKERAAWIRATFRSVFQSRDWAKEGYMKVP